MYPENPHEDTAAYFFDMATLLISNPLAWSGGSLQIPDQYDYYQHCSELV
jgi:hypothetical protein